MVFQAGNVANPRGKPTGYQNFVDRARYLTGTYDVDSLKELVTNKKKFGKLSVFDGMIVMRLYEAFEVGGKDSMNALLDRLIGKPKQEVQVDSTMQVNVQLQSAVQDVRQLDTHTLRAISGMLEQNVTDAVYSVVEPE